MTAFVKHVLAHELTQFLRHHPPLSGRTIQVRLDRAAALPLERSLAVDFADARQTFRAGAEAYDDALRQVYEPIVSELDKLYAASKMIYLTRASESDLQEERTRLEAEIEGRGLRIFPEEIGPYEGEIRLRDALQQYATSGHLFENPDEFDELQWNVTVRLERPCVIASYNPAEVRRGLAGSPSPIYLKQGNPTLAIAKAIDQIAGIGKRHDRDPQQLLGKTPVFLVFKPDSDATLGIKIRQRIVNRGPFEVIIPPRNGDTRYQDLTRAKAALLCRAKAEPNWLEDEFEALNTLSPLRSYLTSGVLCSSHSPNRQRISTLSKETGSSIPSMTSMRSSSISKEPRRDSCSSGPQESLCRPSPI